MKVFFLILFIISHIAYARDSGDASWTKVSLIIYQIHTFLPLTIIHTFCENVFLQAVSHYVSDLSWRRFLLNLINPSLDDIVDETITAPDFLTICIVSVQKERHALLFVTCAGILMKIAK